MTKADDAPIFVVGNARSGTTLMRLMLSAHPRIYVCHELFFYDWAGLYPRDRDGTSFLNDYFRTRNFRHLRLDPHLVLADLPRRLARDEVGLALRQMMRLKAGSLGRVRYGDKSPSNVVHLERIYTDFPDARVIVMFRDPRSNVASMERMPFASSVDLANCLSYVRARRKAWPFRDRALLVRLEDLQREPRRVMADVLDFVGEEWHETVLHHSRNRADPGDVPEMDWFARAVTPLEPPTDHALALSPQRIRLIETMTRDSMRELGYQRLGLASSPSTIRTALRITTEVPGTIRFWWAIARARRWLRDPAHWEPDDPGLRARIRRVNRKADQARTPSTSRSRLRNAS